ncbi:hypothetical protein ACT2CV_06300 [Pasteurellaceae bacterium 22721_9_1]
MFLNHYKQVLNDNIPNDGEGWTIIDAFGGSGLLSHVAKRIKPKARVIYNDFDNYAERVAHIDDINRLRQLIYPLLADVPKQKRLSAELKQQIINVIKGFDGYIDSHILCAWLLFSGQQVRGLDELFKEDFWHCCRQSDYPSADDYLDGIEVVNESFHSLLPKFKDDPKALFMLDPPYLCTHQASYKQARYFDLVDFLRLIDLTRPPYLFFSSTKSEFIRFIDYLITDKVKNWQAFDNAQRIAINTSTSYAGKYEDNLVYKF